MLITFDHQWAQWTATTRTWNQFLHERCAHGELDWIRIIQQEPAYTRDHIPRLVKNALRTIQTRRCIWCHAPLPLNDTTLEHVIPLASPVWDTMFSLERLLSLRLAHTTCNLAYAQWRREYPHRAKRSDTARLRRIRHVLRTDEDQIAWRAWLTTRYPETLMHPSL
ncbi:hypothetical protein [Sulfobacillus thermosulfidooxidans]|uniref:hypothetical protein n=1 Tax=Sulfobacillus thermosulfidooxidans TaxID=28034 RepID=UPI0006B5A466|nr:hypothetical protein [Sulfobacillus thermosulfidooxidans]